MTKIKLPEADTAFRRKGNKLLEWGAKEFTMMQPHIKNYRTCLDIGAHVGITTLRFAEHFKTVHSFEPAHYSFLRENTGHLSNVVAHNCAVSDKKGTVEMYPGTANSGAGIIPDDYNKRIIRRRYTDDDARYRDVEKITVECITIDQFNFDDVDLVKIDVEGHILPVINGMIETLTNNSPVVQIEMSKMPEAVELNKKVDKILTDIGYVKYDKYDEDYFYYKQ